MRHLNNTKKFKRTEEERRRLWIDLTQALILEGRITTFTTRAKWFAPRFERMVTLVKRANGDTKLAYSKVRPFLSEKVARKLIEEVVPKFANKNSGYTRIIKLDAYFSEHDKSVVALAIEEEVKKVTKTAEIKEEVKAPEVKEEKAPKAAAKKTTTKKATTTKKTATKAKKEDK